MIQRSLAFFYPRWGSEDLHWEDFFIKLKLAGFDGVEWAIDRYTSSKELETVFKLAEQYKLDIIAQHYDTYESDFFRHLELYSQWLEKIRAYPFLKLNSQTGKDFFSLEENKILIELANDYGIHRDLPVVHETHRNKFSFCAHITKAYLTAIPELELCLDASHWVCVSESYLYDQPDAMALALSRTRHIHARIGYPQGPQVSDPALIEWEEATTVHLDWWRKAIQVQQKMNTDASITITTEFGPYPYMVQAKGKPIADQWTINNWMMTLIKLRCQ
ncbi:sugar phosphate isomerase/epimerase [Pedobacter aquatilis]|uniref:sugar phosphate isomerase/epimerase n=1 Tax=Pedobacter aquatilis TaxID=351343 RepID=UPI00293179CB|nr:sugar phosphate isomerase/epimerase [Pedobacter aquatilis]